MKKYLNEEGLNLLLQNFKDKIYTIDESKQDKLTGGEVGQVLTKTEKGVGWSNYKHIVDDYNRNRGVNDGLSISAIPVDKRTVFIAQETDGQFNLKEGLSNGDELLIILAVGNKDIVVTFPNQLFNRMIFVNGDYEGGGAVTFPKNILSEIHVIYVADAYFIRTIS